MSSPGNVGGLAVNGLADLDRRVHREASIGVEVKDPEAKGDYIADVVRSVGGFVASNTLDTGEDSRKTANLIIKVPVAQFDAVLGKIAQLGEVKSKNVTGEDITEKVSDTDQTQNVLAEEVRTAQARLTKLGKRASWDDAETARDLKIQLAQARARLVLLKKMAELSTITVTLAEKPKVVAPASAGFWSGMSDTTRSALNSLLGAISTLLTGFIWILIYAPIWAPLFLGGRWLYRRSAPKDQAARV